MNMPHQNTQVRRKSLWRSKNCSKAARFAKMRAAKERKRIERLSMPDVTPDASRVKIPKSKPAGFEITIRCLDDGERVKFRALRAPWGGLTVSPTLAGRKVSAILKNYTP